MARPRPPRKLGRPPRRPLTDFGTHLVTARTQAGYNGQMHAVDQLVQQGYPVTQSLLAKYESGQITDPNPDLLHHLARLYGVSYLEMILKLVREKYGGHEGECFSETTLRLRWALIDAILAEPDDEKFLRSRLVQLRLGDVLDVPGMASWQQEFPDLEQFWVIAPDFLDDEEPTVFAAVKANLERPRPVIYSYFIYRHSQERFAALKEDMIQALGSKKKDVVADHLRAYALPSEDQRYVDLLKWLAFYVIANPHRGQHAEAYQCIRQHGLAVLAVPMEPADARALSRGWSKLVTQENRLE